MPNLFLSFLSRCLRSSPSSFYLELWPDGARVIEGVEDRALKVVRHFSARKEGRIRSELFLFFLKE